MEIHKIISSDISWFNSIFNMENFINELDYVKYPWSFIWKMKISEWFDITQKNILEEKKLSELFTVNSSKICLSLFPLNLGNDKFIIDNLRDLEKIETEAEYLGFVPYVIYGDNAILIFEPDLEILITLCCPDSDIFERLGDKYYSFEEYLSIMTELKKKGFI